MFLNTFSEQPLFHSSMLAVFPGSLAHKQVQLSRWTKAGKLKQIRRGWYMIEKPWRTGDVLLPVIANRVVHPSYLSLEWALQYYDMIPEHVPNSTSVTTGRGITFTIQHTLLIYYHIQPSFFKGYRQEKIDGHKMNIAYPEKALLDKIYLFLHRNPFSVRWLEELRLQNLEEFNIDRFEFFSRGTNWKKFTEAVGQTCRYIKEAKGEEQ